MYLFEKGGLRTPPNVGGGKLSCVGTYPFASGEDVAFTGLLKHFMLITQNRSM